MNLITDSSSSSETVLHARDSHTDLAPSTSKSTMSVSTATASEESDASPDFQGIPPEMRNAIYDLAFAQHGEDGYVDITKKWPALTCVNQQIRSETVKMFLASTDFIAHVKMRNGSYDRLFRWLDMLGDRVRHIKTLTIVCADSYWYLMDGDCIAVLDHWSYIGCQLKKHGITASQFRLPDASYYTRDMIHLSGVDLIKFLWDRCIYLDVIASSILQDYGLLDHQSSQKAKGELVALARRRADIVGNHPMSLRSMESAVESEMRSWRITLKMRKLRDLKAELKAEQRGREKKIRELQREIDIERGLLR